MTTTREKFRAKRAERKRWRFYGGMKWSPAEIRRMQEVIANPLVFRTIYISKEDAYLLYPSAPCMAGSEA